MAGLYIHIPFCKSRCIYCGFYSTTQNSMRHQYANCICRELAMRKNYIDEPLNTIYLGGGTPSQLATEDLRHIFDTISENYTIGNNSGLEPEVTMECNPDDITDKFCNELQTLPINRISMGVQTFDNLRLQFLNRRHNAAQIPLAVERLRKVGIHNISIDLMFGFPNETVEQWEEDINSALKLNVEHISAYSLTYEEGTPLYNMLKSGKIRECEEDVSLAMYETLTEKLAANGFEHYEISNFAKPSFRSRHNSSYWKFVKYLGVGAAAHSFNGVSRQWNVDNIQQYIKEIESDNVPFELEVLTKDMKFDDIVMTRLRTNEGILLDDINHSFGKEYIDFLLHESEKHLKGGFLCISSDGKCLRLTKKGLFVSDAIMTDLMHV